LRHEPKAIFVESIIESGEIIEPLREPALWAALVLEDQARFRRQT